MDFFFRGLALAIKGLEVLYKIQNIFFYFDVKYFIQTFILNLKCLPSSVEAF